MTEEESTKVTIESSEIVNENKGWYEWFNEEYKNKTPLFYAISFSALILFVSLILTIVSLLTWIQFLLLIVLTVCLAIYYDRLKVSHTGPWQLLILPIIVLTFVIATNESDNLIVIFSEEELHSGGKPFTLDLNFGKSAAGYLLLAWLVPVFAKTAENPPYLTSLKSSAAITTLFAGIMVVVAVIGLQLSIALKSPRLIALFYPVNLLTTCVSEEAFSRLAIYKAFEESIRPCFPENKWLRKGIPLTITALIFSLLHPISEIGLIVTFGLAGFFYGLIFILTEKLRYAIILHFLVNAVHFAFFTYPL